MRIVDKKRIGFKKNLHYCQLIFRPPFLYSFLFFTFLEGYPIHFKLPFIRKKKKILDVWGLCNFDFVNLKQLFSFPLIKSSHLKLNSSNIQIILSKNVMYICGMVSNSLYIQKIYLHDKSMTCPNAIKYHKIVV